MISECQMEGILKLAEREHDRLTRDLAANRCMVNPIAICKFDISGTLSFIPRAESWRG